MELRYHAFFCCCTLFGSYPMSVVFILSYWKLPCGGVFCTNILVVAVGNGSQGGYLGVVEHQLDVGSQTVAAGQLSDPG